MYCYRCCYHPFFTSSNKSHGGMIRKHLFFSGHSFSLLFCFPFLPLSNVLSKGYAFPVPMDNQNSILLKTSISSNLDLLFDFPTTLTPSSLEPGLSLPPWQVMSLASPTLSCSFCQPHQPGLGQAGRREGTSVYYSLFSDCSCGASPVSCSFSGWS